VDWEGDKIWSVRKRLNKIETKKKREKENWFYHVNFFIRYFLYLHFKCYPKSSLCRLPPPPALLPYPPTPSSWPWCSPVLGHIKFTRPRGLSSQWWPTRPSSATYHVNF
jgi:hypothetical protein